MLHFPYQPYDYVLRLFNEAATDSSVTEIRATMYRMSSSSAIARALINASKNQKKVVVFVELKARFDEENNIEWAAKMKMAGVKIIYSIPEIKVHAKVALITRKKGKTKSRIAFYGTGNFNEKTAKIYTDHALLTADQELNEELHRLLRHLENGKVEPRPNQLLVAGFNMVKKFNELIEREIEFARRGKKAEITIKLNNLQDKPMIRKLYEAAANGVKIKLIIRGICCLNPEMSDNIQVYRVVGRFLEHGRVFRFENDGNREIFLGSADWMKRNLHHRIEVIFPLKEEALKQEIEGFINIQLSAYRGTVVLDGKLSNHFPFEEVSELGAQEAFYKLLSSNEELVHPEFV
jgi:polyphosphate kinase